MFDACASVLGDPWAWYGLDEEEKVELLAYHRIRTSSRHQGKGGGTLTADGARWGLLAPVTLADFAELELAKAPKPKGGAKVDGTAVLKKRALAAGADPKAADFFFGGGHG